MALSEKRKGEGYVFLSLLLWSFFPVITVLSLAILPALPSLAWSTLCATLFFAIVITYRKKWYEIKNVLLWKYAFLIAIFIGVLFYGLYFLGLTYTTPGNASIIALFEVLTSFLLFNVFRKEHISREHIVGAMCMILGALIILGKDFSGLNIGDVFVLAATAFSPVGNLFQQKARQIASSEVIMFLRSMLSFPLILFLAWIFHTQTSFGDIYTALPFLLISGVFLFGFSKMFWIEATHRISATKAVAFNGFVPFVTLVLAWLILGQAPNIWQLASLVPLVLGVLLLTDQIGLSGRRPPQLA